MLREEFTEEDTVIVTAVDGNLHLDRLPRTSLNGSSSRSDGTTVTTV